MKEPDGAYLIPVPQTILTSGPNAGLGFSSYSLPSTYDENHFLFNGDYLLSAATRFPAAATWPPSEQYRTFGSPSGTRARPSPVLGTPAGAEGPRYRYQPEPQLRRDRATS